jgi:hypothetical protein
MAISLLGPFNKVINETTTQIVDSEIPKKVSEVLTTFISSSSTVVEDLLKKVRDLTREEPPPPAPGTNQPNP